MMTIPSTILIVPALLLGGTILASHPDSLGVLVHSRQSDRTQAPLDQAVVRRVGCVPAFGESQRARVLVVDASFRAECGNDTRPRILRPDIARLAGELRAYYPNWHISGGGESSDVWFFVVVGKPTGEGGVRRDVVRWVCMVSEGGEEGRCMRYGEELETADVDGVLVRIAYLAKYGTPPTAARPN